MIAAWASEEMSTVDLGDERLDTRAVSLLSTLGNRPNRTLKSGCRMERRRFEPIDRVLPCLGVDLIVAWRTLFVCHLGRECPDLDCEAIFEPSEWKAVWAAVHHQKPPRKVPRLSEMVHRVASLGGSIERRNREPGAQTVWIGMQRMYDLTWAWESFGPEAKIGSS